MGSLSHASSASRGKVGEWLLPSPRGRLPSPEAEDGVAVSPRSFTRLVNEEGTRSLDEKLPVMGLIERS